MQNPLATLANKLRSPVDRLRSAEAKLEQVRRDAPQEQYRELANAAISPLGAWHPTFDHAAGLVADAEIALAKAQSEFAAADPEATALRASMRAALESALARLDKLTDPPEPTISSTPEAKALYDQDVKGYEHGRKHNAEQRAAKERAAVTALAKASSSAEAREVLARLDEALAGITDPGEPELGRVCPENIAALERAMAERSEAIKANAAQRSEALAQFRTVAKAIFSAFDDLRARRKVEGLPSVSLFNAARAPGVTINRDRLLFGHAEELRTHLAALGAAPIEARSAKQARLDIAARRKSYEQRPAAQQLRSQALPSARRL